MAAWQLVEAATAAAADKPRPLSAQPSHLQARLVALHRRYSSTTLEQAPEAAVEAADTAAAELSGAADDASDAGAGLGPSRMWSGDSAAPAAAAPAPRQPLDAAERFDHILAGLRQRLASLQVAATYGDSDGETDAALPSTGPVPGPPAAVLVEEGTQTEEPAVPEQVYFRAPQLPAATLPTLYAPGSRPGVTCQGQRLRLLGLLERAGMKVCKREGALAGRCAACGA